MSYGLIFEMTRFDHEAKCDVVVDFFAWIVYVQTCDVFELIHVIDVIFFFKEIMNFIFSNNYKKISTIDNIKERRYIFLIIFKGESYYIFKGDVVDVIYFLLYFIWKKTYIIFL